MFSSPRRSIFRAAAGVAGAGAVLAAAVATGAVPEGATPEGEGLTFFENRIRPVLAEHCYGCHSAEAEKVGGGLKLDTREDFLKGGTDGAVVGKGEPEASMLLKALGYADAERQMPPPKSGGKKLPDAVLADFTRWVEMGSPYPETPAGFRREAERPWSFAPVADPAPPEVKDAGWPATSVDAFLLAGMEARGLKPAPRADKLTLIRRATFALTGLPPTPGEIDAFLADTGEGAFAAVVERLLASPGYGEHWGRHWLDVVRYADTAGDTADYPLPEAWRYRNYVIDAFHADKPYDVFLHEQVAGDILARQGPEDRYAERVVATGYVALSRRFGFDSENYHHLTVQDTLDTLGQSVLGLTVGCARCHDHKFDPVTMDDYYGLYGIFASTRYPFAGSEQKGKYRSLVPLVPVEKSRAKWREMESRFASSGKTPGAVLRSMDDMDGDFEMQRAASGGSNGVLVSPWGYEGKVSVANGAQSPFKHLHAFGTVGARVEPGAGKYAIGQRMHPRRTRGEVHVNLEFRAAGGEGGAEGRHRMVLGAQGGAPAVEVFLTAGSLEVGGGGEALRVPLPKPGEWNCLQLVLDLEGGTYAGTVGVPGQVAEIPRRDFGSGADGGIDYLSFDGEEGAVRPGLELDNIGVQDEALGAVSLTPVGATEDERELAALKGELAELSGSDGDLEGQKEGEAPGTPWHPGPNSGVKISTDAQSPFTEVYPAGKMGIRLPATAEGAYNGVGNHLRNVWEPGAAERLEVGFDFRCGEEEARGTWRFHLGHTHASAAVELGINGAEFFVRNGEVREKVAAVEAGAWHRVRMVLDLKEKTFAGTLATGAKTSAISGTLVPGWEGRIDYLFIDSGGHVAGAKPVLDADNFLVSEEPHPAAGEVAGEEAGGEVAERRAKMEDLRRRIGEKAAAVERAGAEVEKWLAEGPVEMAYGVTEGTPQRARLQIRGEPERPGDEVERGFIDALGGGKLPPGTEGSGRLELARWLTGAENPLTARVMVNRIWGWHFGRGLVATANDFGTRSEPPTHPELLDHLATQFVRSGWSVKAMHRLILLSAAWQQAGATGEGAAEAAENYAGFPRRRLSAEEIRDSLLSVSGEMDAGRGAGHPFPAAPTWGFTQHNPFTAVYEHDKRSVYLMVQRIKRHPFLALFDGADPNASTAGRGVTTVPTQALYFLNDPFVHAKAEKLAERLRAATGEASGQIELAVRLAYGRYPDDAERAEAAAFLAAYRGELAATGAGDGETAALAAYVRTLFGSNEFLHCD